MPIPRSSSRILAETPARAFSFLHGVAVTEAIRAELAVIGYGPEAHQEGWTLLARVTAYRASARSTGAARDARHEIEAWVSSGPRRIRLALARLHPAQEAFVFGEALPEADPVIRAVALLDRLDALANDRARRVSREQDRAALETLRKRGFGPEERARLRGCIEAAKGLEAVDGRSDEPASADLEKLRAWFVEWSEATATVITRRDHLIRLGLVRRRAARPTKARASGRVVRA
jgi:hypothetical protein